jgi:SAM-dependent methyltransferase
MRVLRRAGRALVFRAPRECEQCPACGSADIDALAVRKLAKPVDGRRTGLVSGCVGCGLVFVNPTPSAAELAATYSPEGDWGLPRVDEPPPAALVPGKKPRVGSWVRLFDAIRPEFNVTHPPPGARVLDFGCGRGSFLDALKTCGWQTYGIEPAVDGAFPRHQRLTVVPSSAAFDLVIAHHVLEHVTDPLSLLRQFALAVRPGGYLFVAVPRLDTLPTHRDYKYMLNRVHVTAYTSTCMQELLARAGWELVEPPADEVKLSGGRRTTARLRVLARRVQGEVARSSRPLEPARAALRAYFRDADPRQRMERLGAIRLAARLTEPHRGRRRRVAPD